jgi:hypothetical protein
MEKIKEFAAQHDCSIVFDKDEIALLKHHYEDGIRVIRYKPMDCDFLTIENWVEFIDGNTGIAEKWIC